MSLSYYPIAIELYSKQILLLWYTDFKDGILVDKNNKALIFNSLEEVKNYTLDNHIKINFDDFSTYNINILTTWLQNPSSQSIAYQLFLDLWNLVTDIAYSCKVKFLGNSKDDLTTLIYDKLFYGNNLPSITPQGKFYKPIWTKEELNFLVKVMENVVFIIEKICL
jgi:hypothetical protein